MDKVLGYKIVPTDNYQLTLFTEFFSINKTYQSQITYKYEK